MLDTVDSRSRTGDTSEAGIDPLRPDTSPPDVPQSPTESNGRRDADLPDAETDGSIDDDNAIREGDGTSAETHGEPNSDAAPSTDGTTPGGDEDTGSTVAPDASVDSTPNESADGVEADVSIDAPPPPPEYLEASAVYTDLPEPTPGSTNWEMPVSAQPANLCPKWADLGWKPLEYNVCDIPTATAEAQNDITLVPGQCPASTVSPIAPLATIDLSGEFAFFYEHGWDTLGALWAMYPDPPSAVTTYGTKATTQSLPQTGNQLVYWSQDTTGQQLAIGSLGADGLNVFPSAFRRDGPMVHVVGRAYYSDSEQMVGEYSAPSETGKIPYMVYQGKAFDESLPIPIASVGTMGMPRDSHIAPGGFVLAAKASNLELQGNPCVDIAVRRIDIDGGLKWTRYFSQMPSNANFIGQTSTGANSARVVPLGDCGYAVAYWNVYPAETAYDPVYKPNVLGTPSLVTVYYLTRDGHIVHRADYHIGKWAGSSLYDQKVATDGEDVWVAWYIDSLLVPTPTLTGSRTSVLRLGLDGKPKAFTILQGFGPWSAPHAVLPLKSKLAVVSVGADGMLGVLGPDLCPIHRYDGFSTFVAGGLHEIVRLDATTFAGHDKFRIYFFELPAVHEWEQAHGFPTAAPAPAPIP